MLGIINEHINFQVSPGQPSSITDDAEAVTLTGASQESANQINQKEIHWGNADVVFVCEMIIDIVKHLFIAKFNDIKPFAYSEFLEGPMQAEWDWRFERWKCGTRT